MLLVSIRQPIGIHFSHKDQLVFVSSKSSYGLVYAIDPNSLKITHRYHYPGMTHPTGIVSYDGTLFVLLHAIGRIVTFDINTSKYVTTIASGFEKNTLEQIMLSNC